MTITMSKGLRSDIADCASALFDSDLGRHYFPTEESATRAVQEFADNDHFLVATDENRNFLGFICYIPDGAFHSFPYLHFLGTAPGARGTGVGSQILELFERQLHRSIAKGFVRFF